MGKKRVQSQSRNVRQVRQVRQVRPKNVPAQPPAGSQRKQRERYVQSGGMLQGYAPETVVRIAYIAGAAAVGCVLVGVAIMLAIVFLLHYGWTVGIPAGAVWVTPIVLGAAFI